MPISHPCWWGWLPAGTWGRWEVFSQSIVPAQGRLLPGGEASKTSICMVVILRKGFVKGLCGFAPARVTSGRDKRSPRGVIQVDSSGMPGRSSFIFQERAGERALPKRCLCSPCAAPPAQLLPALLPGQLKETGAALGLFCTSPASAGSGSCQPDAGDA